MKHRRKIICFILIMGILISAIPLAAAAQFNDVAAGKWYTRDVSFVYQNKLMNGINNGKFDPDGTLTRGMLVTVLYRMEDEPKITGTSFTDVPSNRYYYAPVSWAQENGIVNGRTETTFEPNTAITRQEVAAIMLRYTEIYGYGGGEHTDLSDFTDFESISNYAKNAMSWAVAVGMLKGSDGKLDPLGNATRAQIAAILHRYCVNILKWEDLPEDPESEETQPSVPETTEPEDDKYAEYNAAVEAYRQELMSFGKKNGSDAKFNLIYIDEDDIPELVMTAGGFHLSQVSVYTYYNETCCFLGEYGMYGTLPYAPGQNAFGDYSRPMAIQNGKAVKTDFDTSQFVELDYGKMLKITEANIDSFLK